MFKTYFSDFQVALLVGALISFITSLVLIIFRKEGISIFFLVIFAFIYYNFHVISVKTIFMWDEIFHAVVAKNLSENLLYPIFMKEQPLKIFYSHDSWISSHIWLHKQPLFLWQIALSIKLFGANYYAVKFPSIILGSLVIIPLFRMGKLLVNSYVGFLTALFCIIVPHTALLINGLRTADHNDVSFFFYITLSIWAFVEYYYSKKKFWIYFIGLFSGLAILVKWLAGLLVYLGWFVLKFISGEWKKITNYKDISISFVITLLVALPWQIYILIKFTDVALSEYKHASSHFWEVIEGHGGDIAAHLRFMEILYGRFALLLFIPAIYSLYKKANNKNIAIALISMLVFVYVFFSIAKTKMPSFTFIAASIVFLSFASLLYWIIEKFTTKNSKLFPYLFFSLPLLISFIIVDVEGLQELYTEWRGIPEAKKWYNFSTFLEKELKKEIKPNSIVFIPTWNGIHAYGLFYLDVPVYSGLPTDRDINYLKENGYDIIIVLNPNDINNIEKFKNDKRVRVIIKDIFN